MVWLFISSVPDIESRLRNLKFKFEFVENTVEITKAIAHLKDACEGILKSSELKLFFAFALAVGNEINAESGVVRVFFFSFWY